MSNKTSWSRFWTYVAKAGPDDCWEWRSTKGHGYGKFWLNGRRWLAHRWLWYVLNGEIPVGKVVRHSCDNPKCVNPAHLELGTQQDNIQDMVQRGRVAVGENSSDGKLTTTQATEIFHRIDAGERVGEIAKQFGIHQSCVSRMKSGKNWRHLRKKK